MWTEKQIDDWMVPQERTLHDDRGETIQLTQTLLFWEQYDAICGMGATEAYLVAAGRDGMEEFNLPFELAIQNYVGHVYDRFIAEKQT